MDMGRCEGYRVTHLALDPVKVISAQKKGLGCECANFCTAVPISIHMYVLSPFLLYATAQQASARGSALLQFVPRVPSQKSFLFCSTREEEEEEDGPPPWRERVQALPPSTFCTARPGVGESARCARPGGQRRPKCAKAAHRVAAAAAASLGAASCIATTARLLRH